MLREIFNPQSYYFNPWAIPVLITSLFALALGLFVWSKNKTFLSNISYLIVCFSTGVWLFATAWMFSSKSLKLALFWNTLIWFAVPFISSSVYFYSVASLKFVKQKKFVILGYIGSFIFVIVAVKSKYFISGGSKHFWGYYPDYGVLARLFLFFYFIMMIGSFVNFIHAYGKTASTIKKKQIKLIFIGYIIAYLGSVDYLPALGIEVYPFGYVCIFLFLSIIAYTIVRYHAFEIDTVIHRTLMWMITLVMLVLPVSLMVLLMKSWLLALNPVSILIFISSFLIFFVWYYNTLKPKIDHLFRRRKYDYYEVLSELSQRIGSELDLESVQKRLFRELKEILYIRNGVLLVQQPGEEAFRESGSIGYESQADISKQESSSLLFLLFNSKLSEYINKEQKVLEREQIEADPQYKEIKEEALEWFKQREIEILIPIVLEGKVNGLLGIGKKENLQGYTQKDIELLEKMGRQLGITIDNALHHGDIVEKERLAEELKLGREIQMNLLPRVTPEVPGLKLAGLMIPAKEIGGDYYDYIVQMSDTKYQISEKGDISINRGQSTINKLSVVIGDVSGKGVAAGLIMATAKATLKGLSQQGLTPKGMLTRANNIIHEYTNGEKFMTMLYLEWDCQEKKMSYSSAGHEHIIIYRNSGKFAESSMLKAESKDEEQNVLNIQHPAFSIQQPLVEVIQSGGFMIGMMSEIGEMLEDKELSLQQGDKVVLYTDGVTEAHNPQGDLYSLERLVASVRKHGHKPAEELIEAVRQEVYGFISTQDQYDDITLVGMEIE